MNRKFAVTLALFLLISAGSSQAAVVGAGTEWFAPKTGRVITTTGLTIVIGCALMTIPPGIMAGVVLDGKAAPTGMQELPLEVTLNDQVRVGLLEPVDAEVIREDFAGFNRNGRSVSFTVAQIDGYLDKFHGSVPAVASQLAADSGISPVTAAFLLSLIGVS